MMFVKYLAQCIINKFYILTAVIIINITVLSLNTGIKRGIEWSGGYETALMSLKRSLKGSCPILSLTQMLNS